MEIKLKNIGIVNDSTMSLNGLTVITGKNNSGKTTVGKALYSLLDAVSNISAKASSDRERYILERLDDIRETLDIFNLFYRPYGFKYEAIEESPLFNYPNIQILISRDYRHEMSPLAIEEIAKKIKDELLTLDVDELSENNNISFYVVRSSKNKKVDVKKVILEKIKNAVAMINDLFSALEKDPQLIEYTRECINQTLNMEFSGQIQPASFNVEYSAIELYDDNNCCFKLKISDNRIVNDGNPVFFTVPYKKVFFIDNPFLFDEPKHMRRFFRVATGSESDSLLNPNNILPHNIKLRYMLRTDKQPSILEQTIINESLEKIKKEIDSILPGSFEFSPNEDYYIQNGTKLKMSNLATGSKMFSIIKILLEKGELGKTTMLILDEPEAHLHPAWQNHFAEMIVLLVKELGVNVLLTTHSSNFVLALDAYMRKHQIEKNTNFYRTEFNDSGMVDYSCSNEDIGSIYQDFLQYLSEVKMLRNQCMRNAGEES